MKPSSALHVAAKRADRDQRRVWPATAAMRNGVGSVKLALQVVR